MHSIVLWGCVLINRVVLSFVLAVAPLGNVSAAEGPKWVPYVDVEGKLGTDRNLGEVSLFVPLGQSQDSLFFGNLISRIDDQDSFEGNVGLGYREIIDGSYILGGYAFYDHRRTASDNSYNQITLGGEFLTDKWTVRGNAYLAEKDLNAVGGGVVTQTGTQIFVQSNLEGAYSGFDAEVGRVIPLGLDDATLSGFVGGFHFGRSDFDPVTGPRVRAELAFNNLWDGFLPSGTQMRFGAEVQHDDVRDTQGFLSARLRVPLFGNDTSNSLSALDQRMVDPVVRDIDVVAGGGLSTPVAPVLLGGGSPVQGVSFIDGSNDLGAALLAAGPGSIVIIDGANGPVTSVGGATVQQGQVVVGAQSPQFQFTDPTTGQTIIWSPTPTGVRPTVLSVLLSLPSDGVVSGIDLSSSLVLPAGGGASFNLANIFGLVLTGNVLAGGSAQCATLGVNLVSGLNTASTNGTPLAGGVIAGAGGIQATNQALLTQLNLQLAQAQAQNCLP